MNNVVLVGRIANDLELKGNENKVVNFNLAVDRVGKKDETDFIPVVVFGKNAENIVAYQGKGSQIAISGHIRQEQYVANDGAKRNTMKVIASRVEYIGTKKDTSISTTFSKQNNYKLDDEDMPF